MATLEMFRSEEDSRREWRRVPVRLTMRCRRLGPDQHDVAAEAIDLSPGGVRLLAPDVLAAGDVVSCCTELAGETSGVELKGLVVQTREHDEESSVVHVAWTNLGPPAHEELRRLLAGHAPQMPATGTGTGTI